MQSFCLALFLLSLVAPALTAQPTIFIVRHAEKAEGGDARDPGLSEAGRARAECLSASLREANITAVYASEFKRTRQTAEPIARARDIEVIVVPAKETAELVAKLQAVQGNALVVAHSNTIAEIAKALGASVAFTVGEADYDDLFILAPTSPAQLLRLHLPLTPPVARSP